MTLSRYVRDYLYIPLGGDRHGYGRYVYATLLSMGLCGLWHGAGWTFVAWGLMHGAGLIACRAWQAHGPKLSLVFSWFLTMLFVLVGWVLFRASDFHAAGRKLAGLAGAGGFAGTAWPGFAFFAALMVAGLGPSTREFVEKSLQPSIYQGAAFGLMLVACVLLIGRGKPATFIYFQF